MTSLLWLLSLSLARPLCAPVLGGGVERPEGPTVSQVDWLGASADGTRAGLLVSRDGYRSALVYELGSRMTTVPDLPADPAPEVAAHVASLRSDKGWMSAQKLDSEHAPEPISWCQTEHGIHVGELSYTWSLVDEPCKDGGTRAQFRICNRDGSCAEAPELAACWTETPRLVDVFATPEVLWFVVERPRERSTPRMAVGVRRY